MKIKTAALLSTAVIGLAITLGQTLNAQEADNMNDVVPTVGESVSNAGKAVANNVKDSAAKATNAAKGAINSVVGSIPAAQEPEEKEKPGDNAPTIMPPDFELSGVVGQASKIGEDVLILQQDQKRLAEMKTLIDQVGIENALLMYPELSSYLVTSPMVMSSQLERVKILNQLREEVAKANGPTQYELDLQKEQEKKLEEGGTPGDLMSMNVNDDGTVPAPEAPTAEPALTREDVAAIIEEERLRVQQEDMINNESGPKVGDLTISEVYGANGQMVALLTDGISTYKVRVGDEVPDRGVITIISKEGVTLALDGAETEIKFR